MEISAGIEPVVPISAIEHYAYCPRQCALIYLEQVFAENVHTVTGRIVHERVHGERDVDDSALDGRTLRGLTLYSDRLGLIGQADLVEMRPEGPYPVEYKSGRVHQVPAAQQLCAQALCLEEMYGQVLAFGAIYLAAAHRRREVEFTASLRLCTLETISAVRTLLQGTCLPGPATNRGLCMRCSLRELCLPQAVREIGRLRSSQLELYRCDDSSAVDGS
ncbi:MAG: CRISPR-associated protein Cas4 [Anaerolineales bacterium]|nr:CRISPR-associated protein Cas4 [Anaerolineales bacterium]